MGLGYGKGDVVDKCHLDPRLAKGKRPGEGDMGKLLCEALFRENVIHAPTTWATIDTRIVFLIEEATRWESHYGPLDKKPTGNAKCKRVVHNVDKGKEEVQEWPWQDWMWPMIRLGRQRKGVAAAAAVKKDEDTTAAAALRAEQLVARITSKLLVAPASDKAAMTKELEAARDELALLSGGRRGGKGKGTKSKSHDSDSDSDSGSISGGSHGDEAAPTGRAAPKEKGRHSGVDAGLASLLKQAGDGSAQMLAAIERMSADAAAQREHDAAQAEKGRAHEVRMEEMRAAAQKDLLMGLIGVMKK